MDRPGIRPGLPDFVKHIEYVADLVGIEHVGIGLDFDETNTPENYYADNLRFPELVSGFSWEEKRIQDLTDASQLPNVTRALVVAGFTREEIDEVLGLNLVRVLQQVWGG